MKGIINFFYEIGILKRTPRSGWALLGIKNPESVAEHVYRSAVIGYVLAVMENVDPGKVTSRILFHDMAECRTGDLHKVAQRYIEPKEFENRVVEEQVAKLPDEVRNNINKLFHDFNNDSSKEAIIANDADLVEVSLSAMEYANKGFKEAKNWIENSKNNIKSESAKKIFNELDNSNPNEWWHNLKNIKR